MFRAFLFCSIFSFPSSAFSDEICGYGISTWQTSVRLVESDDPDIWVYVQITNLLAQTIRTAPCIFEKDGEQIRVFYSPFSGDEPDYFRIEVPIGYYADPNQFIMEDNTTLRIPIRYFTFS
jgi:hypothetical protein